MSLFTLAIGFAGGLVVGWMVLPAPKFVTNFWIKRGWAQKATGK